MPPRHKPPNCYGAHQDSPLSLHRVALLNFIFNKADFETSSEIPGGGNLEIPVGAMFVSFHSLQS